MTLEAALAANTAAMIELTAALLKAPVTTKKAEKPVTTKKAEKPVTTKKAEKETPEVKKPEAKPDTVTTNESPETQPSASNDGAETGSTFTYQQVADMVTKYAAATVPEGRAKVVAVLQRHGLKNFRPDSVNNDQALIGKVGAMLAATFEGEGFDPREAA